MDAYDQLVATLALTMGTAWASGINLYAAVLMLGLGGTTGAVELPESLAVVENPLVIAAAGIMYAVEFFADKVPGVDTGWDGLHTFVRIPAGALLAAGAVGPVDPSWQVAAGLFGGSVAGAAHATKSGARALINTSPEPFSNWTASLTEDAAVFGGLWLVIAHPWTALVVLIVLTAAMVWLLPRIWRGLRAVGRQLRGWFESAELAPAHPEAVAAPVGAPADRAHPARSRPRR